MTNKQVNPPPDADVSDLLLTLTDAHKFLQQQAAHSVDLSLVVRNWLFGWYIVEFENGGGSRHTIYGKRLLEILSKNLSARLGAGFSKRNLEQCRRFYQSYGEIAQTLSAQSFPNTKPNLSALVAQLMRQFRLGWSHYVILLTLARPLAATKARLSWAGVLASSRRGRTGRFRASMAVASRLRCPISVLPRCSLMSAS